MSNRDLKREPQHVGGDQTWWYYEQPRGLDIIVEDREGRTRAALIPWARIRAALRRKDKPARGKR